MFSKIARPPLIASIIVTKLSSASTISAVSRVTSVPFMPIAMPTSAFLIAGASFMPSPVIAITYPFFFRALTMRSLFSGILRAYTAMLSTTVSNSSSLRLSSSSPVMTWSSTIFLSFSFFLIEWLYTDSLSESSPISLAIAFAVFSLSPVIIITFMPASLHASIAAFTSSRGGSFIATSPRNTRSFSVFPSSVFFISLYAIARTRSAFEAI